MALAAAAAPFAWWQLHRGTLNEDKDDKDKDKDRLVFTATALEFLNYLNYV